MPAFDYINKAAAVTFDISAAITKSTAAVEMSRAGLVKGLWCVVEVGVGGATSAVDLVATGVRLRFTFEYSTDNGSHYRAAGNGEAKISTSGVAHHFIAFPVTLDIVTEQNAPGDIQWRVTGDFVAVTADADDFDFAAFLTAGDPGIPAANID